MFKRRQYAKLLVFVVLVNANAMAQSNDSMRKLKQCQMAWDAEIASRRLVLLPDKDHAKQAQELFVAECMKK